MKHCFCCDKLTKHKMKIRLNGKSLKFPMCEDCQLHTAIELTKTDKENQKAKKL